MQILKGAGIDWRERRLISKLYRVQSVNERLDEGDTRRGIRLGPCMSRILFTLYRLYLTDEALEGFGDFKVRGQVIRTVKYKNKRVLLAKEVVVLHGILERQLGTRRRYGMEMRVQKTRLTRNSRKPSPVRIMIDQKQQQEVGIFQLFE